MQLCCEPGCSSLVDRGRCPQHARAKEQTRAYQDIRKLYSTVRWARLRQIILVRDPFCGLCHIAPSTDVDHIEPHKGNRERFWDEANLWGLCHRCHSRKTQEGK